MPKRVIALEANLDASPAEGSVKSLKAQLREAQAEVVKMSDKFGETSTQAANAAKKAAELKDRIGDAKALTDAFSPDKKFNAFAGALQGVVGGFTAVQGAMGLLGSESQDVEKVLLKVQSAMALTQGLNAVTESIDTFKNLGTVLRGIPIIQKAITAAQWLWNAAMAANPIGAIVAAVAALIAGIVALTKYLIDNSNANKTMAKEVEKSTKALKEQTKAYEKNSDELQRQQNFTLELAKAKGATTKEIRALEKKLIDEKVAHLENARQIAVNTFETEKNTLAKYKASGASDEVITKQRELTKAALEEANKVTGDLNKAYVERVELQRKHIVQVEQENTNAATTARQNRKKEREEAKAQAEKDAQDLLNANKDQNNLQKQLQDEITLAQIEDERKRAEVKLEMDLEAKKKEIENSKASAKEKNESIALLEQQYMINLRAMRDKFAQEDKDIQDKKNQELIKNEEELTKILEGLTNEVLEEEKKASEEKIKIAEAEAQAKIKLNQDIANSMGALSDVIGKETAVGKGLAVAQATMNTYLGATEVLRAKSVLPEPLGTISKVVNVATIIATGIKSVKSILSTKVPGSGGGGGTAPSLPSTTAPIQPQLGQTALNQQLINQTGNAAVRAFVLETDVSGNQERIRRLNRAARIN
jgi:hypothetical protein